MTPIRPPVMLAVTVLLAVMALLAGCTSAPESAEADDPADASTADESTVDEPPADQDDEGALESEEAPPPSCRERGRFVDAPRSELTGPDAVEVAVRVAERTHRCAPIAVLAAADDPWAASLAASVAHALDSPLLLAEVDASDAVTSALSRLDTEQLITVGVPLEPFGLPGTELLAAPPPAGEPSQDRDLLLALTVADHLGTDRFLAVGVDDVEARAAALTRIEPDVALLPLPGDLESAVVELPVTAHVEVLASGSDGAQGMVDLMLGLGVDAEPADGADDLWPPAAELVGSVHTTWLADPADGTATAVAAVAARGRDEALLPIDGADLRADRERTSRLREVDPRQTVVVGAVTEDAPWQLATVLDGEPLPGGGFRLFEDERMVALYGSVETAALGALGEQGLDDTIVRLREVAAPYGADGAEVLPAFELIATTASATEQPTGDYSRRTPLDLLRPWVDRAAEEGLYVMLDLQPGRTDFLTQAREYEELLREPHVGLALDPEWRLGADQRHLRQIGSVSAEEVQEVADWLAGLTREANLPQKLLVLHQFRFSMLPDRDTVVAPPELAVVVHMDGQGPIGTKYETYGAITAGAEDRWSWGWKNFYDEDAPTPTPSQVLELDPLPVLVTYQ